MGAHSRLPHFGAGPGEFRGVPALIFRGCRICFERRRDVEGKFGLWRRASGVDGGRLVPQARVFRIRMTLSGAVTAAHDEHTPRAAANAGASTPWYRVRWRPGLRRRPSPHSLPPQTAGEGERARVGQHPGKEETFRSLTPIGSPCPRTGNLLERRDQ
jgi:hypothetical protein